MKKKFTPTEEQKAKRAEKVAKLRELSKAIAAMSPDDRAAFAAKMPVIMTCEGHIMSGHNTMLLCSQMDSVTIIGGFNQWKAQGRAVRKGESALAIWIPASKKADPNKQPGEMSMSDLDVHFFMGSVFDVSQTDPMQPQA